MTRPRYVDRRAFIKSQLAEIDAIIDEAAVQQDLIVRGHLERLAVIRLSGFVEKAVEHMIVGFFEENTAFRVLRIGKTRFARVSNLNPTKLENLVGDFDETWRAELSSFLEVDERRQSLGNLIGARHALAHGGQSAVSAALLRNYHEVAKSTVDFLADRFIPSPQGAERPRP
jgi:D-serine dehydratase